MKRVPMPQVFTSRNLATRFRILIEMARAGRNVQQRDIAGKLGITTQAVSEYVIALKKEGLILSEGRSRYVVTREGVDWAIQALRELQDYAAFAGEAVTNITVCAAVAGADLAKGQRVGLVMKEGLLYASDKPAGVASGVAVGDAIKGQDVGITGIEGIVDLAPGSITVLKLPGIWKGGSRATDIAALKKELKRARLVGCKGIEAFAALKRAGLDSFYMYGVTEAAVEAAHCGLPFLMVCTEGELAASLQVLEAEGLHYRVVDLTRDNARLPVP